MAESETLTPVCSGPWGCWALEWGLHSSTCKGQPARPLLQHRGWVSGGGGGVRVEGGGGGGGGGWGKEGGGVGGVNEGAPEVRADTGQAASR